MEKLFFSLFLKSFLMNILLPEVTWCVNLSKRKTANFCWVFFFGSGGNSTLKWRVFFVESFCSLMPKRYTFLPRFWVNVKDLLSMTIGSLCILVCSNVHKVKHNIQYLNFWIDIILYFATLGFVKRRWRFNILK